ncbi:uncharacterized protein [Miscanthus floridulus]|uniref:uncharacterized protein n=1 Tax=Miscanthus floridulus TaxID=154761 RepID=UPI00345B0318
MWTRHVDKTCQLPAWQTSSGRLTDVTASQPRAHACPPPPPRRAPRHTGPLARAATVPPASPRRPDAALPRARAPCHPATVPLAGPSPGRAARCLRALPPAAPCPRSALPQPRRPRARPRLCPRLALPPATLAPRRALPRPRPWTARPTPSLLDPVPDSARS